MVDEIIVFDYWTRVQLKIYRNYVKKFNIPRIGDSIEIELEGKLKVYLIKQIIWTEEFTIVNIYASNLGN